MIRTIGTRAVDLTPFFVEGRYYLLSNDPVPTCLVQVEKFAMDMDVVEYRSWPGGELCSGSYRPKFFTPLWYEEMIGIIPRESFEPGAIFVHSMTNRVFTLGPKTTPDAVQILADWPVNLELAGIVWDWCVRIR